MKREPYMKIIKSEIEKNGRGRIYVCSDFLMITNSTNIRKALSRLKEGKTIRRLMRGVYDYPEYSKLLQEYVEPDMNMLAEAIARNYGWNISPGGNVALNQLGLSTQVPSVWSYISDGPYKKYEYKSIVLEFKHRANKEISGMSNKTLLVINALKTLGKEQITLDGIKSLQGKLSDKEKQQLLAEAVGTTAWIFEVVRQICQ